MRIVANYGTSLLDYLNSDKDINQVLAEKVDDSCLSAAAKKTLEQNGIYLNSQSSSDDSDNLYSDIRSASNELRDHAAALSSTKEDSLFATAEKTGKTDSIVTEVNGFVANYNTMLKKMNEMGGEKNTAYAKELAEMITASEEDLKKVGVTTDKDGYLNIDKDVLSKASVSDLQTAFAGKNALTDNVAKKSIYVEANAISAMCSSSISNYSNGGTYTDSTLGSFLQSI